jgi:hypothetical protein
MVDGPGEIVLVYNAVGAADQAPAEADASPEASAVSSPQQQFVGGPQQAQVGQPQRAFVTDAAAAATRPAQDAVGQAALDRVAGPASAPPRSTLPLSFDAGGERISVTLAPETFAEVLFGLYIAGGWPWVRSFMTAVGSAILPTIRSNSGAFDRLRLFLPAAQSALASLNDRIASALVAIAEQTVDKAQELATNTAQLLTDEEQVYGIKLKPKPDTGQGGAEGGGGSDTPEEPTPTFDKEDPDKAAAANDLVIAVEALVAAFTELETARGGASPAASGSDAQGQGGSGGSGTGSSGAGGGGGSDTGQSGAEGGTGKQTPPDPARITAARDKLTNLLRDASAQHKLAPGIAGLCLAKRKGSGALGETVVFEASLAYMAQAREALGRVPASYNSGPLGVVLREELPRKAREAGYELKVVLDDTPETRAAVYVGRATAGVFEPLALDALLEHVRSDIFDTAKDGEDEDRVRALFAIMALDSYLAASDARTVVARAEAEREGAPIRRGGKLAAALSLIGLRFPPALVAATAVGVTVMFASALQQFDELARTDRAIDTRSLDALLAGEDAQFAQMIAMRPRGTDVLTTIGVELMKQQAMLMIPVIGTALGAYQDVRTLVEDDVDG